MNRIAYESRRIYSGELGEEAPAIYVIDSPEHPLESHALAGNLMATVVTVPVRAWNDSLTPWPAPGLHHGDADFKGEASATLSELLGEAIPTIERGEGLEPVKRAICGYSLGGLFALYAFAHSASFDACACLSGSVWYEGWVEHLRALDLDLTGKYAFFSIGSREKKAGPEILRRVEDDMNACAEICRARGCDVEFEVGPGSHAQYLEERLGSGLKALDSWL